MEKMSMSHEDYLEAIVMLGGTTQVSVRSVDIATKLGVSKASVNKAMTTLKEKGLADQPYYGDITLTPEGYAYGTSVLGRHDMLFTFLTKALGIPPDFLYQETRSVTVPSPSVFRCFPALSGSSTKGKQSPVERARRWRSARACAMLHHSFSH